MLEHFWRESTNWQFGLPWILRLVNCFTCPLGCNPRGRICFRFRVFGHRREGPLSSWRRPAQPESCEDPFQKACRVKKSRRLKQFGHFISDLCIPLSARCRCYHEVRMSQRSGADEFLGSGREDLNDGRHPAVHDCARDNQVWSLHHLNFFFSSVSPELLHWQEATKSSKLYFFFIWLEDSLYVWDNFSKGNALIKKRETCFYSNVVG